MNFDKEVSDYIKQAPNEQIEIMNRLLQLIHEAVPGTTEAIKWGFPVVKKVKDFAYIRAGKKHITLGFYNVDKINDPDNLLEGTGKTLRHIKIKKLEDINAPLLANWFKAISN